MTEQELRQEFKNHSDCYSDAFEVIQAMTEDAAIALAKAYADARESKEIAELKAESKYWNERWEAGNKLQDAAFNSEIENYHEVKRLNAEIKRLRDGIKKGFEKLAEIPYCSVLRTIFDNAKGVQNDLESLLSPAPVTEGPKKTFSLQMYGCNRCEWYGQVGESIETESYDVCPKCLSEDLTLLDSPKNEDQE